MELPPANALPWSICIEHKFKDIFQENNRAAIDSKKNNVNAFHGKNIFPTEPIQLVCEVRQNICFLISISAVILKLMVQDHIHFL